MKKILFFASLSFVSLSMPSATMAQGLDLGDNLNRATLAKPVSATAAVKADSDEDVAKIALPKAGLVAIGEEQIIKAKFEDTLLQLGRDHNLGYVEIIAANPGVDPWLPGEGTKVVLPKRHLLPNAPHEGIVINVAEMRMYSYVKDPANPETFPIGIGREGLNTPLGVTTVTRKKDGPTWTPTERMRREKPELPASVKPGPDNPLGTHALYLGWPTYLIHGTNKPLGVGRRASSGCIRMYPEDIIQVFGTVPVGTKINVVKQPIKLAWVGDMLYLEAHAEDELADSYEDIGKIKEYRVPETLFTDLATAAGDKRDQLDWNTIRQEVKTRSGRPVPILLKGKNEVEFSEDILKVDPATPSPQEKPRRKEPPRPYQFNS